MAEARPKVQQKVRTELVRSEVRTEGKVCPEKRTPGSGGRLIRGMCVVTRSTYAQRWNAILGSARALRSTEANDRIAQVTVRDWSER